jgi:hypothetical protein
MRALLLFAGFVAGAAAVVILAVAVAVASGGNASSGVVPPQHVTLEVFPGDAMIGPKLVVQPGPVVLTIRNYARHAHTFSVPQLGIEQVVLPGSSSAPTTTVVRFTAPRGAFTWFCRLPCKSLMSGDVFAVEHPPKLHGPIWATA